MLPDSVAAYDPWLLPLVLVGVPVLAGLSWLLWASALGARFHDHPPRHPRSRVALVIGMGAILLSTSAAMVWYPRPGGTLIAPFGSVVLMVCFLYLSGVSRPLRLTTNEPYRLDGTVIGLGGMMLLTTGLLLWASAIYLAIHVPHLHALRSENEIERRAGLTAAALWSGILSGFGAYLHHTWRRLQAQRK